MCEIAGVSIILSALNQAYSIWRALINVWRKLHSYTSPSTQNTITCNQSTRAYESVNGFDFYYQIFQCTDRLDCKNSKLFPADETLKKNLFWRAFTFHTHSSVIYRLSEAVTLTRASQVSLAHFHLLYTEVDGSLQERRSFHRCWGADRLISSRSQGFMGREAQTRAVKVTHIHFSKLITHLPRSCLLISRREKCRIHDRVRKHFDYSIQLSAVKYSGKNITKKKKFMKK